MEVIDNKLNSNNPMLIAEVFSKLIENITIDDKEKKGFNFLKKKCFVNDFLISEVATASILKLVENGTLQIDEILADFITSISTASNVNSITKIIAGLYYLQLLRKLDSLKEQNDVRMQILQHPFIKILKGDNHSETQMCMYKEIVQSYNKDLRLSPMVTKIYYPVYLYCICSPTGKLELSLLRHKLWTFLLKKDLANQTDFVLQLCSWIQMQGKTKSELSGALIDEALLMGLNCTETLTNIDHFILLQILVVYNMVLNNVDCHLVIETIMQSLLKTEFCHHNLSLLILSKAVIVCSPINLEDLLRLCLFLLNFKLCKPYSYLALKSSLLPWVASPSLLTQNALKIGENILNMNDHICQERPAILASRLSIDGLHYSIFCNPEIFLVLELGVKMECTKEDEFLLFLEKLELVPIFFLKNSFTFVCGLLLSKKMETESRLKVFSMIVKCSSQYTELCPIVLTLILYQLSNSNDSKFLFELLKALPLMARVKENVPKIIATIQVISNKSNDLANFALRLMYNTWEIDHKCYSSLENILTNAFCILSKDVLESNVSKAYIFKKLSEKSPELYGRDLVAYLSKLLNECVGLTGSIPTALAIEGIAHLCKAEIIDVVTTWATLAPKFKDDTRVPVIKSLCQLISEIPHLQYTQTYDKLNEEVLQHLWNYVTTNDNEEVINAALDALASFSLELICSQMPDVFLDENFAKQNPLGEQRIVPGKSWLTFLSTCQPQEAAKNFLIKLVSNEIEDYLKYVYQVKAQREPENYGGLPTHSIVRALGEFLSHNATKVKNWDNTEKESIYTDCLKILSLKYSKPLPPLDWCFLQELIHNPKLKNYCLDLASHQAVLSGSARRLVESYIVAIMETPKHDDSMHIYRNLKYLANSIQPMVIKPFIENSLHFAFNEYKEDLTLVELLDCLKEVLRDDNVQHINKNVIEEVLRQLVFVADISSKAFPLFLNCIVYFSQKGQEEITKFSSAKFDQIEFEKFIKIRCYIAANANSKTPLNWLNDIFEVASKNSVRVDSYFDDLTEALKNKLDHEDSPMWLMEHFGQIQAKVAERCELSEIEHFCDILAIAVIYFSGFFVLLPKYDYRSIKYFVPAALAFLLDEPIWSICTTQVLEWLHHMNTAESIPKEYQHIFGWSLCCLRHQDEFSKSSKWMKYLDCEIYTDNKN